MIYSIIIIIFLFFISALFFVDTTPLSKKYIFLDKSFKSLSIQDKIKYYRENNYLPDFFQARSPGISLKFPPIGWVLTYDDPINLLIFVSATTKKEAIEIIKKFFKKLGYFETPFRFGFLTRYPKPIEIEMFYDFKIKGESLQMHLRGFYAGEDIDFGYVFFFNGHVEYGINNPFAHLFGKKIPPSLVNSSEYLTEKGTKWESFEKHLEMLVKNRKEKIVLFDYFDYNNEGYYFGKGKKEIGDIYYYVDGKIPVCVL
jgi:hypothetical protein